MDGRGAGGYRAAVLAWGLCAALLLGGCNGMRSHPRSPLPDNEAALLGLASNYDAKTVNTCLATALDGQRGCRDTIVQAMMAAIDLRYADFELDLFDTNRYGNFGATVATLGLTAAGTLSGGNLGRALAAAAAGVVGTREAFDREVLAEKTMLALQSAMQARRNEVALRIRDGLLLPATEYPLGVALSDLYAYFRSGTILGALVGVTESTAARSASARAALNASVAPIGPERRGVVEAPEPRLVAPGVAAPAPRPRSQGLDTGPVAMAMRAWIDASASRAERRERRADIVREAQAAGYRGGSDAFTFIGDPAPGLGPMKAAVARALHIIP